MNKKNAAQNQLVRKYQRKLVKFGVFLLTLSFFASTKVVLAKVYIPVGEAKIKKSVLAFPDTKPNSSQAKTLKDLIVHDLDFTHLFKFQSTDAFIEKKGAGISMDKFKMSDWSTIGTEFLIKTSLEVDSKVTYELRLYDVIGAKQILGKRYVAKKNELEELAHTAANDIVEALTGKKSVFFSKIAMVCDKTGHKEIWVTDFDGSNPKQITFHRTLAFAPEWSRDNKNLAYSLYTKNKKNIKNIDLYEYYFKTKKSKLLSNRKGINSGAAYSPDGKTIALTMSFLGNPDIFTLDPKTKKVTRISKSFGVDVDPAWSPDGTKMAFVSSRSGRSMVYTSNSDGSNVMRRTFAGLYNATPRWHPNGKKLVFSGYLERHFDLFMMDADGTNLERLTKNEGSNEDPHFSPDGNFIAFTSNRSGQKNVYLMTSDGENTRRITFGLGNCEAPKWSNPEEKVEL